MNNSSSYETPSVMATAKTTFYSLIMAWSLLGNLLVLLVVFKNQSLRTNFNILIVNMAISDLVIPCLALPMKIAETNQRPLEWKVDGGFGNFLCKLCYFTADISPVVSSFSLVIIAVNRFFAIALPLKGLLSRPRTLTLVGFTWFIAIVLLSPYFYTYKLEKEGYTKCINSWSPAFDDAKAETAFIVILITVVFALPCITIGILYSVMLWKLRQNSNRMADMLNDEQMRRRQRKDRSVFIMTIIIMFLYLFLWGPFFCTLFVLSFFVEVNSGNEESVQTVILVAQILGYLNSAVNPCIYFYFLNNLREGLKRLLRANFSRQEKDLIMTRESFIRKRSTRKTSYV